MKLPGHLLVALVLASTTTGADDLVGRYEVVPFAGFRTGGEFDSTSGDIDVDDGASFGLVLNARADYNTQYQVLFSHQCTELNPDDVVAGLDRVDIDVDYLHVGGTYHFDNETVVPYIAGTVGMSRFDPDGPGLESENFFSFSLAGGLRLPIGERFAMNLEARWLGSFVDSDSEIFCVSSSRESGCLIRVEGNVLSQVDVTLGAVIRFQ